MSVVLVNYASRGFEPYQSLLRITAKRAGIERCLCFGRRDLEPAFVERCREIFACSRGDGYWLWKPYLLARVLSELRTGDRLLYCDAGLHFVGSIEPMIAQMERLSLDLLLLGEGFRESQYTKRDAFVLMECDTPELASSPQRFASCFLLVKSAVTVALIDDFLRYALDPRILTDRPNEAGLPDHSDFVAHRHDQSILSLLSKTRGIPVPVTPFVAEGLSEPRGQILNHTRKHHSPAAIAGYLLSHGLVSASELAASHASTGSS